MGDHSKKTYINEMLKIPKEYNMRPYIEEW